MKQYLSKLLPVLITLPILVVTLQSTSNIEKWETYDKVPNGDGTFYLKGNKHQSDNHISFEKKLIYEQPYIEATNGDGTYTLYYNDGTFINKSENYKSRTYKTINIPGFEMTYLGGLKSFSNKNNLSSRTLKYTELKILKLAKTQDWFFETTNRDGTKNLQNLSFFHKINVRDDVPSLRNYEKCEVFNMWDKLFIKTTHRDKTSALYNFNMDKKTINFNTMEIVKRNDSDMFKFFSDNTQTTYFYDADLNEHEKYRIVSPLVDNKKNTTIVVPQSFYTRHQTAIIITIFISLLIIALIIWLIYLLIKKRNK